MKGVKVVVQDGYVKISYTNKYSRKRFSTGVRIDSSDQITTLGKLKGNISEKEKKQNLIDSLKIKIETLVQDYNHDYGFFPSTLELEQLLNENKSFGNKSERLLNVYEKFHQEKINEFSKSDTKSINSLSSHRALKYYLEDYEVYTNKPIYLFEINRKWLFDFKKFNETKRENSELKVYKTFGGVKGSTIKKKVGVFINFMKWASDNKYCVFPSDILGFSKEIALTEIVKSTVTKNEVLSLVNLELTNPYKQFVRDLFVFSCLTGMRWSDLISLNKKHIKKIEHGLAIIKKAEKTKNKFTIYLNDISQSILERHDYNLNRMTNPAYNRELKKFLKSTGLFNDTTDFEVDGRYLERWETISIHRGRDSFITILLGENVPPNAIMQYTGHKQLRTLEGYVDKNTKVPNFMGNIFDNGKN